MTAEPPELFALYGEWKRLEQVAITSSDEKDDWQAWQAAWDAEDRFYEMPARSPADVLFKLRVCCLYGLDKDEASRPLPAIMRDLERMAGNVAVPHPV